MVCPNCKVTLPESAKFCTMCGAKVNVSFCPNGHVLEPGESSCRYCPTVASQDSKRISLSTTIENLSYPGDVQANVKATTVEMESDGASAGVRDFGKTRIILEQDEETVGIIGWLVIVEGAEKWRDFKITKKKVTLGRSRDCDFVLDNSQISSKHASVRLMDDGLYLTDLDSSNGTFVADQEVVKQKLLDNDLIRIGEITLRYKAF